MNKPKFRVGQVVRYDLEYYIVRAVHQGHIHISDDWPANRLWLNWFSAELDDPQLRPLTKREKGAP